MKRNINLVALSREHHFGLLCCWKIKEGVKLGIEYKRIKNYINFFWNNRLSNHFNSEDLVFDVVKRDDDFIKMDNEHDQIKKIISLINQSEDFQLLIEFADLLQNHIRFEEREFFPKVEETLSESELEKIGEQLNQAIVEGDDNYFDEFWKKP